MIMLRYVLSASFALAALSCWAQAQDAPPQAVAALQQMRSQLRDAKELEFTTQFHVVDKVLGRNVKGSAEYKIRKPNLLRITVKLPTGTVVVISDGKTLTIHEPNRKRYEEMPAKDSIVGSIYLAAGNLGEQTRLVDFFWTVDFLAVDGSSGRVGTLKPKTFGSKVCDGFTVKRAQDVWSVWLERSPDRRPCYVVSKTTGGSAFVTQTNALRWTSNPKFSEATFRFAPPAGHRPRN
jgi:outer membrane lipoprotein-sorting protein